MLDEADTFPLEVLPMGRLEELEAIPWLEEVVGFPEDVVAFALDVLTDMVGRPTELELEPLEALV